MADTLLATPQRQGIPVVMVILDVPRADPFGCPVRSSTFGVGGLPGTVEAPEDLETPTRGPQQSRPAVSFADEEGRGKHRPPPKAGAAPLDSQCKAVRVTSKGPWACDPSHHDDVGATAPFEMG